MEGKTAHLVVYDYGLGGVWAVMLAQGKDQIGARYPRLTVVDQTPAWMGSETYDRLPRYDVDEAPDDFLRAVADER
jgi:hypothetical protein